MEEWNDGIFYIESGNTTNESGLIVSCGIHGDETLPIRAVETLKKNLQTNTLQSQRPVLILFCNLSAISKKIRFEEYNMNRLFGLSEPIHCTEWVRVKTLEDACQRFARQHSGAHCHIDLHSTIKPSLYPVFALQPVGHRLDASHWLWFFQQTKMQALIQQTDRANTFSQFTGDHLNWESITVECGANSDTTNPFESTLNRAITQWVEQEKGGEPNTLDIKNFVVYKNIIKHSDQFSFCVDETAPNFTNWPKGTTIFRDHNEEYICDREVFLLFGNSQVAIGQRAGLLLTLSN